jgi:RNA-directed DNA polymerase
VSLVTPDKIRRLQRTLYVTAKQSPAKRFHFLYDKVWRDDMLAHAYALSRANGGAPGVDGETFADIEAAGRDRWLAELREEVRTGRYTPQPVRRVMIPKALEAVRQVSRAIDAGRTEVVDADLSKYFDTIPHAALMACLARRISDGRMLRLIKLWLKAPVMETDENGNRRMSGGKKATQGTPQGGVVTPRTQKVTFSLSA